MKKFLKGLLKFFAIVTGIVVGLVVLVLVVLLLPTTAEKAGTFAIDQVENALQAQLEIGSLEGSPLTELVVKDIVLKTEEGAPIFTVRRLVADVHLMELFSRTVWADLEATGVDIYLHTSEEGVLNLSTIAPPEDDQPATGLPISLRLNAELRDTVVVWRDERASSDGDELAGLGAQIDREMLAEALAKMQMPAQLQRQAPHTAVLTDVSAMLTFWMERDTTMTIDAEEIGGDLASSGVTSPRSATVEGFSMLLSVPDETKNEETGTIAASVRSFSLAEWLRLQDAAVEFPPAVDQMSIGMEDLSVTQPALDFFVPEAGFRTAMSLSADFAPIDGEGSGIAATATFADHPDGRVEIGATIKGWESPGPDTEWKLALVAPDLKPSEIAGAAAPLHRISASLTASGTGIDPATMAASAEVGLRNVEIDRYTIDALYARGSVDQGAIDVPKLRVATPYASASASGRWRPDGDFAVKARAQSTDRVAQIAQQLFGREVATRADLDIDAEGNLDLGADDPIAMLRELDADVGWDVGEFVAEDVRVGESRGALTAQVTSEAGGIRRVNYRVDATGRDVGTSGLSLEHLSVQSRGRSTVSAPGIDTMNVLKRLTARADIDVRGFSAGDTRARNLDLFAEVRPSGNRLAYTVRGSAEQTSMGEAGEVGDAAVSLKGDVALGETLVWPGALRALKASGGVSARGLKLGGDQAGSIDAVVDIAGPISDLRGSIRTETTQLALAGYEFEVLDADLRFVGDRVFEVDAEGRQKEAKPSQVEVFLRGRYARDLTDFEVLDLVFRTVGDSWTMSDGFSIDTKTGTLSFEDVRLTHGDQAVRVDGYFRPGEGQDLTVEVEDVEIASIADEFGITGLDPLRARVNANATLGGTAREPTASFSIRLEDVYWEEYGPFAVFLEGRYGELDLVLERFEVDGYGGRIVEGNATLPVRIETSGAFEVLQNRKLDLFLEMPTLDVDRLYEVAAPLKEWGIDGRLGMKTRLRGTFREPSLNMEIRAQELVSTGAVDGSNIDVGPLDATFVVRYENPDVPAGGLEATLNATWQDEPPIQALARVRADAASWLRDFLDGEEIDWGDRLGASPWKLMARAQRFDLKNLRVGPLREADAEGFVTLEVDADGTLGNPVANLDVSLEDFGWNRYRDIYLDIAASLDRDILRLENAKLEWDADEILVASGSLPAPFEAVFGDGKLGELPIDFQVQLQPLPVAKFSAVDYSFASFKGELSGFARLSGTLTEPIIDGRLSAIDMEFADKSRGTIAAKVAIDAEDRLRAGLSICTGPDAVLEGAVSLPIDLNLWTLFQGEELAFAGPIEASLLGDNVRLAGLVPRKVFDDYVSDVNGFMDVDLRVSGTVEQPQVEGKLQVARGALFLGEYSRGFKDVAIDLEATSQRVDLRRLYVADERGHLSAKARLELDGFKPGAIDGEVEVRDFGTTGITDFAMFISADVGLGGNFSGGAAEAKATISELEVIIPDTSDQSTHPTTLNADIVIMQDRRDRLDIFDFGGSDQDGSSGEAWLRLAVEVERNSWIRHPMAEVEIMADLDLEIAPGSVLIGGEAQTIQGQAEVLGKKFTIAEGLVTFTGQDPPNPRLQIEAVHTLDRRVTETIGPPSSGNPRAIVRVTGRASDPRIRFMSDPEMAESDVLYTLITGRPPGQADAGSTDASGLATGAASGLASGLIQDQLGQVLPVDFDVVRFEAGDEGFADPSLEVGKYITTDVYISIETKFGAEPNENTSEFNIEYRFLPRWVLEFQAGNLGTGELNVFWDIY